MAINNWRSTYDPDYIMSQIKSLANGAKTPEQVRAEDRTYSTSAPAGTVYPSTNPATSMNQGFSPAETYKFQADWYYNQGNTALWDAYNALWKWSNAYSKIANDINNFYSQLWEDVYKREMSLAWAKQALADKLYEDMWQTRQYALNMFWPNGQLTREVNTYYDDLWNYLATDAGRQAAEIAAQWLHSWASLWAIRAQQNQAYNESFARYVQAKEQEINAKQAIANNLINYMSTLRREYWDTTNQYIIQQYQRANDLLNSLSQNIANSNIQLAQARLWWGWSSSSNGWYSYLDALTQAYLMKELGLTDSSEDSGIHSNDNLNQ